MATTRLEELYILCIKNKAGLQEREEFLSLLRLAENKSEAASLVSRSFDDAEPSADISDRTGDDMLTAILNSENIRPLKQVFFIKNIWIRYAAAIIILFGAGIYYWMNIKNPKQSLVTNTKPARTNEILPGTNRATLTLSDGSTILLDSAANGQLGIQNNTQIIKTNEGQIDYNSQTSSKTAAINIMSTPKGGQYKLKLPDGTRVWLNAESSITYPTAFIEKQRRVKIKGEAYFEVAGDKSKTFIVDVDDKQSVEVLGTSFNINSYADEGNIKTTLLDGSLKVTGGSEIILKPGQQAQGASKKDKLKVLNNINIDEVVAWKNGLFNFEGANLQAVMHQLERWYDIQVNYESNVPDFRFRGELDRGLTLSEVLHALEGSGVKFKLKDRTLTVLK